MSPKLRTKIIAEPTAEPITLAVAREHLRVVPYLNNNTEHPDDALILALLSAAREHCENFTGLSLVRKTYEGAADEFPEDGEPLELPHPPFLSLDFITYGDDSGDVLAASDVEIDSWSNPQRIYVAGDWPSIEKSTARVRVRYEAGFRASDAGSDDTAPALPFAARAAILLVLGHLYENREASVERALQELPMGVEALLRPLRVRTGMA